MKRDTDINNDNGIYRPSKMRIADLCDDDKPREKALAHGIRTLSDTELIALLLSSGIPGKSVIELSHELYNACNNSLSTMAQMSIRDMSSRFQGIGIAKAITIAAALELGSRRKDLKPSVKPRILNSADAYGAIRNNIENEQTEEFWVLLLSRAGNIIAKERISIGGTAATVVEPKMVMKRGIEHLAASIILVHNHPSGNLNPSPQDDALTKRIKEAGKIMDINIVDHLIITPESYYSYADNDRL